MKIWMPALVLAACACAGAAVPRIGVLDLGLGASSGRGPFGCPSEPAVFVEALSPLGEVFTLSGEDVARKETLSRRRMDLLVVPTGSAWPADAADALVGFLCDGGSLLTCGGYAFDSPVVFRNGAWRPLTMPPPAPAAERVPLPDAAKWSVSMPIGQKGTVSNAGDGAIELKTDDYSLWCTGAMPVPGGFPGKSLLSFRVRSQHGASHARLELVENDGSRWIYRFAVSGEWREITAWPALFHFYSHHSPKNRGGARDMVDFGRVKSLSIGCGPREARLGEALAVGFADLRCGVDPDAEIRRMPSPQINTRRGRVGDAMHVAPTQINAFDPSFELSDVARIATVGGSAPSIPALEARGAFTGFAAVAQLGVNGYGCIDNRCSLRPIIGAFAEDGSDRGPAASFVHHFSGTFKGSSWAIFGVDNVDLFARGSKASGDFLREVASGLLRRMSLNGTTTYFACYRAGETAVLKAAVGNFGSSAEKVTVRFTLKDDAGRKLSVLENRLVAAKGANTLASCTWAIGESAPDYVTFTVELADEGGKVLDRDEGAFVVWSEKVVSGGPKLEIKDGHFAVDGRVGFWTGAQTFWGQTRPTTARSPLVFNRDFRQMRAAGMRFTRLFFPWTCEEDKRISDACVQLAQKHGLVIYHTQQNLDPMVEGKALDEQNAIFRDIAARYRDVPGFMVDIRNEPHMSMPPSWKSARQMRHWLETSRAAAREGRPGTIVSVGWMQGWGGETKSEDPAWCTLGMDFTDRHFYGDFMGMYRDIKDVDMRAMGKPLVLGECGAKCHPSFEELAAQGEPEDVFAARFRCLATQAYGLGATAMLVWLWRDPPEGIFPCGLVHSTGVPRKAAVAMARISDVLGGMELVENPPDVAVLLREEPRMRKEGRMEYIERSKELDGALLHWGANWSKITEGAIGSCRVKLVLDPDSLPSGRAALREEVGRRLRAAGCSMARRDGDADALRVFRVPGKGAVAWLFWNCGDVPVEAARAGRRATVLPGRTVYMQVSDAGAVESCKEL